MKRALIITTKDAVGGGNERFITSLAKTLLDYQIIVDVKYISIDESSPESILLAYRQAQQINTKEYDVVFSTKFPSYCAEHPLHINLHNHWFKRFYDEWKLFYEQLPKIEKKRWFSCRKKALTYDKQALRKTIIIAQSQTVQRRLRKQRLHAYVLPPPPILHAKEKKKGKHFLIASMLDNHQKRIDLAIQAYRFVKTTHPLIITGTGKDESYLKQLASHDARIKFVGKVSDEKLKELYSEAIATIHVAKDEDFGLSVAESLASGCPVITCHDSGGATEQVIHDMTGIICPPRIEYIVKSLQEIISSAPLRKKLLQYTHKNMNKQTWKKYVQELFDMTQEKLYVKPRNAEEQFIMHALRKEKISFLTNIDWEHVVEIARQQGILPYVYTSCVHMPISTRKEFEKQIFKQKKINNLLIEEYQEIQFLFKKHNISYMPLKGITLLTKENQGRATADIDILVREQDKKKARTIILQRGFTKKKNDEHEKKFFEEQFVLQKGRKISIELKTKLDETFPLGFDDLQTYQKEKLFCFYAHHAIYKHPFHNLKWLFEGKELLQQQSLNLQQVLRIAKKHHVLKSVKLFLFVLKQEFNVQTTIKFSLKDKERATFYYSLHNLVSSIQKKEVLFRLERIQRVLLSQTIITKIKSLYKAILPDKGEILPELRKKRFIDVQKHINNKEYMNALCKALRI